MGGVSLGGVTASAAGGGNAGDSKIIAVPGKVPRNVLKQLYGKQVKAEVVQSVVERGLSEAVTEHEIEVVAVPQLEDPPEIKDGDEDA